MKRKDETDEAAQAKRLKQKAIERWENEGGKIATDASAIPPSTAVPDAIEVKPAQEQITSDK